METSIEQFVREFVHSKTEEAVELHLTPYLHIRHVKKRGSILLAVFWANLLQHPSNFPKRKYSYRKMIDKKTTKEKLVVHVPEIKVTFSVVMATGTLIIQGNDIYAWFKDNFTKILDNYDEKFKEQFIYDSSENKANKLRKRDQTIQQTTTYITDKDESELMLSRTHTTDPESDRRVKSYMDEYIPGLEYLAINNQEYLNEDELKEKLSDLSLGGLHDGYTCVYKTWKSLLRKWFKTDNTDIYIVTPFIDEQRFKDIVDCFMDGHFRGRLRAFYVPRFCDGSKSITELKRSVIKSYKETRLHVIIEHHIYRNILFPSNKEFEGKFIAGVNNGMAEVLVTSAGFNDKNFRHKSLQTAHFITMEENMFTEKYLSAVESPVAVTMI